LRVKGLYGVRRKNRGGENSDQYRYKLNHGNWSSCPARTSTCIDAVWFQNDFVAPRKWFRRAIAGSIGYQAGHRLFVRPVIAANPRGGTRKIGGANP
jgi:hypothetical protein